MDNIKKLLKIIILLSFLGLAMAMFNKSKLPDSSTMRVELKVEPIQETAMREPIIIRKGDYRAKLEPKYKYEISGLVVEDYDSESWLDVMHKKFDPFNTRDLCLLWGSNVENNLYNKFAFSHGEFTCFFETKNLEAYRTFNKTQISNNHLIPANEDIYRKIKNTSISDQVRIKGYLVDNHITTPDGNTGSRTSSVTRTDTGNGACELIYVEEFEVIQRANIFFFRLYNYSIYTLAGSLLAWLVILIIKLRQELKTLSMYKKK